MSGEWISPLNRSTAHINGTHLAGYFTLVGLIWLGFLAGNFTLVGLILPDYLAFYSEWLSKNPAFNLARLIRG